MTDDSPEALIARLVAGEESFVTRWVVIAEMIESDGERVVICAGAEDMQRWDSYGLLTEALEVEKAHHLATRLEDGP